jgi:predicted ATPase
VSELADRLDHPYSNTVAALHAATLRAWIRRWPACEWHAERALQLARQGGFEMRKANAMILQGIAAAHQGRTQEGIDEIAQGLFRWEASGARLVAYGRNCLAEAQLLAGRREEGLRAADEALYPREEVWWLPEQYRLRAELLLQEPRAEAEAEALLRRAADLAKSQKARSLELRALTSLARLQSRLGHGGEGKERLAECYASFTEGFDQPDLQEAEALLEELQWAPEPSPSIG